MQRKKLYRLIFIVIGLSLIIYGMNSYYEYYKPNHNNQNNNVKLEKIYQDTNNKENHDYLIDKDIIEENTIEEIDNKNDIIEDNSFATISIPSINLEKVLYDIDSNLNNVNYNIEILKESIMPSEEYSHLFLASHSGNNYNAYFNDLPKLKIGDKIYIFYDGIKYTYEINKIFEVDKDGKIEMNGISNIKMLTLITCHIGTNKQIIVNSYLINEELLVNI